MENTTKIIAASVGAILLGATVYYLSMDDSARRLDPKRHTLEKLKKILAQCKLEYTCIYARNYNIMQKQKENGVWSDEMLENMKGMVNNEIDEKTLDVVKYQKKDDLKLEELTVPLLEAWIDYYKNEKEVKQDIEGLEKLYDDVFVRMHVD